MAYIGRTPTGSILTSADIADGSISTAKLADTAVSTAKLANDAVDNTKLDLAANYAFTGTVTGTPQDLVRLTTTNYSSAVSEFDFVDAFSDTYDNYMFTGRGVLKAASSAIRLQFMNGSSAITGGNYDWSYGKGSRSRSDSDYFTRAQDSTYIQFSEESHDNTTSWIGWFDTTFKANTSKIVVFHGVMTNWSGNGALNFTFSGMYHGTSAVTGFKIFAGSGNFSAGSFSVYGVKKS